MIMFNVKINGNFISHKFPTIQEAYNFYLDNYAIKEDYEYYKNLCGLSIYEITNPKIMECIFINVFEYVVAFYITD